MHIIFKQVYSSLVDLLLQIAALVISWIFDLMNKVKLDDNFFFSLFPSLNNLSSSFKVIGFCIAFLLFVFSLFLMLFPYSDIDSPADNAYQLVFRFAVALFCSYYLTDFIYSVLYEQMIVPMFDYFNVKAKNVSIETVLLSFLESQKVTTVIPDFRVLFENSLVLIFSCVFIFNAFKFVIYHFEKMFLTVFLIYCAPVASGTLATKNTSNIFKNYLKLFFSNSISLVFNIIISKLILQGLLNLVQTVKNNTVSIKMFSAAETNRTSYYVIGLMLLTGALKVGKKISVYLGNLFQMNGMSDSVRDGLGMIGGMIGMATTAIAFGSKVGAAAKGAKGATSTGGLKAQPDNGSHDVANTLGMSNDEKQAYYSLISEKNIFGRQFNSTDAKKTIDKTKKYIESLDNALTEAAKDNDLRPNEIQDIKDSYQNTDLDNKMLIASNGENPKSYIDKKIDGVMNSRLENNKNDPNGLSSAAVDIAKQEYVNQRAQNNTPADSYYQANIKGIEYDKKVSQQSSEHITSGSSGSGTTSQGKVTNSVPVSHNVSSNNGIPTTTSTPSKKIGTPDDYKPLTEL